MYGQVISIRKAENCVMPMDLQTPLGNDEAKHFFAQVTILAVKERDMCNGLNQSERKDYIRLREVKELSSSRNSTLQDNR